MLALAYQLFSVLAGWLEAILYARRGAETFTSNEHGGMTWQRISVLLVGAAAVAAFHFLGWWALVEVPVAALLFPAFHDEAYNFTRLWIMHRGWEALLNRLPDYPTDTDAWRQAWQEYRYGYQSPTTTARNDFNGRQRTGLAIAGGVVLLALYVLVLHPFFLF